MNNIKDDIYSILEKFYNENFVDDNNTYFVQFKDDYLEIMENANKILKKYNKIYFENINSSKTIKSSYDNKINFFYNSYIKQQNYIKSSSILNINKYSNLTVFAKNNLADTIKNKNDEKYIITAKTNPLISTHFRDRNNNILINENKIKEINNNYNDFINKLLDFKEDKLLKNSKDNNIFMANYQSANSNINSSYEDKVKNIKKDISEIDNKIEVLKHKFNQNSIAIEKEFNQAIIGLQKDLKDKVTELNIEYDKDKDSISSKRDESNKKNNDDRSFVIKDFIKQIEIINNNTDKLNKEMEENLFSSTLPYNLKIFDIETKIRKIKETIHNSSNKKQNKILKCNIKKLNVEKKLLEKELKNISISNQKKYVPLQSSYNEAKDLYESIKNKQIKKLDLINDINDNASHNKLSLRQTEYEFDVLSNTQITEIKIHKIRNKFDLKKLNLIKQYKTELTNLYIEKQKYQKELNLALNEIELSKKLNKYVTDNANEIYDNITSKINTQTLLEIEKNNILKELNEYKLCNEITDYKNKYDYLEKDEFLKRDKKNKSVDYSINQQNLTFNHNKIIYSLNIQYEELKEKYLNEINLQKYNNYCTIANANYTLNIFNNNKKLFNTLYVTIWSILKDHIKYIENITQISLGSIKNNFNDIDLYITFQKKLITSLNETCCKILKIGETKCLNLINEQINFETGSKYKTRYDSIDIEYKDKYNTLREYKISLGQTLDNYKEATKKFYHELGDYESRRSQLIHQLKRGDITKSVFNKESHGLKAEIDSLHSYISKNDAKIEKIQHILDQIPYKENLINKEYARKKNKISLEQKDEASNLYQAKNRLKIFFLQTYKAFSDISMIINAEYKNFYSYIRNARKVISSYSIKAPKISDRFLKIVYTLERDINNKYDRLIKHSKKSYNNQTFIYNKKYDKDRDLISSKIDYENNEYSQALKENNEELEFEMNNFDDQILDNENEYNSKKEKLINDYNNYYKKYLIKSSSVRENILSNINLHNEIDNKLKISNKENNDVLVKLYNQHILNIEINNNQKLLQYNQTLKNIPYEVSTEIENNNKKLTEQEHKATFVIKQNKLASLKKRKTIEFETRRFASKTQNKITYLNILITKERKAIAQKC